MRLRSALCVAGAALPLCAPPAWAQSAAGPALTLRSPREGLRLGVDASVELELQGPDVEDSTLEVHCSVGTVTRVARRGPGRFSLRYVPPEARAPDVALVLVRARGVERPARLALPLLGRYRMQLAAEPRARVTVRVGGGGEGARARVSSRGRAELVLFVPPGLREATVEAVDRAGNRTVRHVPLEVPPLHRVLVLPNTAAHGAGVLARWWVAAAQGDGSAPEAPPRVELQGVESALRPEGPGLYVLEASLPRRATPTVLAVRVREPGVTVEHPPPEVTVPASIPARLEVDAEVDMLADEVRAVPVRVLDAQGERVVGLEGELTAMLRGRRITTVQPRGDGAYDVLVHAPERAGRWPLSLGLAVPGRGLLGADVVASVRGGFPVRVVTTPSELRVGEAGRVPLRGVDRFGNEVPLGHPRVRARGARVRAVEQERGSTWVELVPEGLAPELSIDADGGLFDRVLLRAEAPARAGFEQHVAGLATVRSNLGPLWLGGARARWQLAGVLRGNVELGAQLEPGVEGGALRDATGAGVSLWSVPLQARAVLRWRAGRFGLAGALGGGARGVGVSAAGDAAQRAQNSWMPMGSALVQGRLAVPGGALLLELHGETGALAGALAAGVVGGVGVALGWEVGP